MSPKTDRAIALKHFYGLTSDIKNFAFEMNVILGSKSIRPDAYRAKWR